MEYTMKEVINALSEVNKTTEENPMELLKLLLKERYNFVNGYIKDNKIHMENAYGVTVVFGVSHYNGIYAYLFEVQNQNTEEVYSPKNYNSVTLYLSDKYKSNLTDTLFNREYTDLVMGLRSLYDTPYTNLVNYLTSELDNFYTNANQLLFENGYFFVTVDKVQNKVVVKLNLNNCSEILKYFYTEDNQISLYEQNLTEPTSKFIEKYDLLTGYLETLLQQKTAESDLEKLVYQLKLNIDNALTEDKQTPLISELDSDKITTKLSLLNGFKNLDATVTYDKSSIFKVSVNSIGLEKNTPNSFTKKYNTLEELISDIS